MPNGQHELGGKWIGSTIAEWALGQQANTVLLAATLGAIGWLGHYTITIGIPAHLNTIQEGYSEVQQRYEESLKENRAEFRATVKEIVADNKLDRDVNTKLLEEIKATRVQIRKAHGIEIVPKQPNGGCNGSNGP